MKEVQIFCCSWLMLLHLISQLVSGDPCVGDGELVTEPGVSHTSPGYEPDGTGSYPVDTTCIWNITAPQGMKIRINITDIYIEEEDSLIVYDESIDDTVAESEENQDLTLAYSTSNAVIMTFVSDVDITYNGFKFHFEFFDSGPCSDTYEVITGGSGQVASEGYQEDGDGMYGANADCVWIFKVLPGYKLELDFSAMSLEDDCDFVTLYNDDTNEDLSEYSGEDMEPFSLGPFRHSVRVAFTSDPSYQYNGFLSSYDYTAPVPDNQCTDSGSASEGDIVSCDCRVRYLKHTAIIAPSATPCLSPPNLVGRRWDNIQEQELTCSLTGEAIVSPLVRAATMRPHRPEFCAWPPVVSYHDVTSLLECTVLCMEAPDCLYVNVKEVNGGMFRCGVSSFLVDMPTEPVADPQNWTSYLVAQ